MYKKQMVKKPSMAMKTTTPMKSTTKPKKMTAEQKQKRMRTRLSNAADKMFSPLSSNGTSAAGKMKQYGQKGYRPSNGVGVR